MCEKAKSQIEPNFSNLLQSNAPDHFIESRVVAQTIESRFDIKHCQLTVTFLDCFVQICKRLFLVAEQDARPCLSVIIARRFLFVEL